MAMILSTWLKNVCGVKKTSCHFAGRWFLKSLLADVEIAHLHLAEAVLVMYEGGPLDTPAILKEIDLPREVNSSPAGIFAGLRPVP